ncbi:MAG: hypothetical protein AAGN15_04855 [Cyanobacteria bacterium J06581_3]
MWQELHVPLFCLNSLSNCTSKAEKEMKKVTIQGIVFLSLCSCLGIFQTLDINHVAMKDNVTAAHSTNLNDEAKYQNKLAFSSQLPRFGFKNISANLTFLSFLQYFGDESVRDQEGYGASAFFFESIVKDDPFYNDFYFFLSNSISLRAAQPEKSVEILQKGLSSLGPRKPEGSYYVWRYKAIDELLFLGDSENAKHSFETAASWARESDLPESEVMALLSQKTANFLEHNPESKNAQIGAWSSVLTTAIDNETRTRAIKGIEALGGEVTIGENGGVNVKYAQADEDTES